MRKALLLACLFLLLFSACDRAPRLQSLPPGATLLAFGDSLTHGTGAGPGEDYPSILSRQLGRNVVNAGVPGETTAGGLARLPTVLAETRPALVILCLGGNDFLQQLPSAGTVANLREMVRLCRAAGADVVLVGVPRPGLLLKADPLYAALAAELKVPLENDAIAGILQRGALKSDHIHPNARGYAVLAEALAKLIQQAQK